MFNADKFIPKVLADQSESWRNYRQVIQQNFDYFAEKIYEIWHTFIPEKTNYPIDLANLNGAYLSNQDTNRAVKTKIFRAFRTHKFLPVFELNYKPIIDARLGGDSQIYKGKIYYGSFIVGSSIVGTGSKIGVVPFSPANFVDKNKGEIYIDLGAPPTQADIDFLKRQFEQLVPIYFNIYFGLTSVTDSDFFVVGSSLVGGVDLIGVDTDPVVIFDFKFAIG
ncbi:hypothetical protein [Leptospira phage LE3]|uniref:Uncharacterized protein n=1 Tax=Leptospira phage LE3 TaxID=2041382 RepID=A0A343LE40_9CAUD|nr:hypothetical protein HWB33_gp44 [Leptospira phage LE3]ATN94950.1 hypothetical protein [Leptospira phage LE3]